MPEFKLVDQAGKWLEKIRLGVPDWKPATGSTATPEDTLGRRGTGRERGSG